MRCFFLKDGRIAGVELLDAANDEDAIAKSRALFARLCQAYDGFEVWHKSRRLYCYPDPCPQQAF